MCRNSGPAREAVVRERRQRGHARGVALERPDAGPRRERPDLDRRFGLVQNLDTKSKKMSDFM